MAKNNTKNARMKNNARARSQYVNNKTTMNKNAATEYVHTNTMSIDFENCWLANSTVVEGIDFRVELLSDGRLPNGSNINVSSRFEDKPALAGYQSHEIFFLPCSCAQKIEALAYGRMTGALFDISIFTNGDERVEQACDDYAATVSSVINTGKRLTVWSPHDIWLTPEQKQEQFTGLLNHIRTSIDEIVSHAK